MNKKDNNSVFECCICDNYKKGEFIIINEKKYHLCCIENLQQENNQLKEQLEKKYEKIGTLTSEILYEENTKLQSVLKDLRSWLEVQLKDLNDAIYATNVLFLNNKDLLIKMDTIQKVLSKLNELEGGKNE